MNELIKQSYLEMGEEPDYSDEETSSSEEIENRLNDDLEIPF